MAKSVELALVDTSDDVEFPLAQDVMVIGRAFECDIVIEDKKASRKHCRVLRKGEYFSLEDLDSRHGTIVNGKPLDQPWVLGLGDEITIGRRVFVVAKKETPVGAFFSKVMQRFGVN